jgi:hypothetical protein
LAAIFRILDNINLKLAAERDGPLEIGVERAQAAERFIRIKYTFATLSIWYVIFYP